MAVTARANSNIAFIKYWGNADHDLRLPLNPTLSMNLEGLYTETTVTWDDNLTADNLELNGKPSTQDALNRVTGYLGQIRARYGITGYASVISSNNFPTGAGIASSASAFSALALAATRAAGLELDEAELSALARLGSGSASRSVPTGFVEWHAGDTHETSYAESIAPSDHWPLLDIIAIVSAEHKPTGSTQGHRLADTSDLQAGRLAHIQDRFDRCRQAVLDRDFATFAEVVEKDSDLMHAVMMTSNPPLFYWEPASLALMEAVRRSRAEGLNVCYTLDAGPNVHCLCTAEDAEAVEARVKSVEGVLDVRVAGVGKGARIISS